MIQILHDESKDQPWRVKITGRNNKTLVWGEDLSNKADALHEIEAIGRELGVKQPNCWLENGQLTLREDLDVIANIYVLNVTLEGL